MSGAKVIERLERDPWRPSPQYTLLGVAPADPYCDYYLDSGPAEPRVVAFPHAAGVEMKEIEEGWLQEQAGSLPELIGGELYKTLLLPKYPLRKWLIERSGRPDALPLVEPLLLDRIFEKEWFSTETGRYFSRSDGLIRAIQRPHHALALECGFESRAALEGVKAALSSALDFREK